MKKTTLALIMLAGFVQAAEPVEDTPSTRAWDTTLTLSYESRYVLYGYRLSRHLLHADVAFYHAPTERTGVWGGVWYGYLPDGTYHEVDVYAGIERYLSDTWSVGLGYSLFNYIEVPFPTSDRAHEFAAYAAYQRDAFGIAVWNHYDTEAEGHLTRLLGHAEHALSPRVALRLEVETGYAWDYFIDGHRWNHGQIKWLAPVHMPGDLIVSPFVARSLPFSAIRAFEEYETFYGISVSVSR